MQNHTAQFVSAFGSLDSGRGWNHADVDGSCLRSVGLAVHAILVATALAASTASAQTVLPPVIVTPGPDTPIGPSGGGGGGGANYPTEGPQGPTPAPFDCAEHVQSRPAACPVRATVPGGSRYTGSAEPDRSSALGRIFAYLDSGQPNISPVSRNILEGALASHTRAIADGQMTQPGADLALYEHLEWACEAQVNFDPSVYPDPVPYFIGETRFFNDTARDCYQAVFATRSEMGLEDPSLISQFLGWLGETLSSLTGTSITATVNLEGSVGPVTMSLDANTVAGSLAQKWNEGRNDVICARWYDAADTNGCAVQ